MWEPWRKAGFLEETLKEEPYLLQEFLLSQELFPPGCYTLDLTALISGPNQISETLLLTPTPAPAIKSLQRGEEGVWWTLAQCLSVERVATVQACS